MTIHITASGFLEAVGVVTIVCVTLYLLLALIAVISLWRFGK